MTPSGKTLFEQFESRLPAAETRGQPMPPENVPVLVKCASLHAKEFEAMVVRAHGRSGLRWQIFNLRGRPVSYPHRGWQPDSWRFKNKEEYGGFHQDMDR